MTRRPLLVCATAVALISLQTRSTSAQQLGPVVGAVSRPSEPAPSPANGVQLGESVILHSGVGVEGGYDTNIFYNDDQKAGGSLVRVTPFIGFTNTARNGEVPSGVFFDSRLSLTYREYFSSEDDISRLRSFTPTLNASLEHNSRGTLALGLAESFARLQDAPYFRDQGMIKPGMIIRDSNSAAAYGRWSPGGGRLQGLLRYTNNLDLFENEDLKPANSMGHEAMLDLSWRWFPKTALYFQVRQGYISYLNDSSAGALKMTKASSFPLRAVLGIRGLITEKTSVSLALGYQNSFYSDGQTTGGFLGSTLAAGELVITPLIATRISVGGRHEFQNSIIGNFYYVDGVYASLSQQTLARLIGQFWGSYEYRRYYGLPGGGTGRRNDNVVQAGATLDYFVKSWAYVGASYTLAKADSDVQATLPGVNYTKHLIFARLGVTY